jgi:hypothetical protein|nr:MAG TPA: hypothetical protein [Caudoviricetes sp.]
MDIRTNMTLQQFIKVRYSLLELLKDETERGTHMVQYAHDNKIIFWDRNNEPYIEDQYDYLFSSEQPSASGLQLHVANFVYNRRNTMKNWGLRNTDVVNYVNKTYDTLMGIISKMDNSYSLLEKLVIENRDTIYRVTADGERHFITHIEPIDENLPLSRYDYGEEPIDIRVALDTLHMLQCCFDPKVDHEYNSKRRQAQEGE